LSRRAILPARYPVAGSWPAQMRADMTAAFLDFEDTKALAAAVTRGEAPPPSAMRGAGRAREPVWNRAALDRFLAREGASGDAGSAAAKVSLANLV
jgi:hypothetical protein